MSWFEKLMPSRIKTENRTRSVPQGIWIKCPNCDAQLYRTELERNLHVCPKCDHHMRIGARQRLASFLDDESIEEIGSNLEPQDPLKFRDSKRYRDRLLQAQKMTGEKDALVAAKGNLLGHPVVVCAFEFSFMGGSMGSVVGERFRRAAKHCMEARVPLVSFSASGGARMQEALFSLLQMAKTAAVIAELGRSRIPYISVLTDPTTGGVSASLARAAFHFGRNDFRRMWHRSGARCASTSRRQLADPDHCSSSTALDRRPPRRTRRSRVHPHLQPVHILPVAKS